jgi:hypothetical protein
VNASQGRRLADSATRIRGCANRLDMRSQNGTEGDKFSGSLVTPYSRVPRDGIETRVSRVEGAGDMLEKLMSTFLGIRRLRMPSAGADARCIGSGR